MGPPIHQVGESPEHGGHEAQSRIRSGEETYPLGRRGPLVVGGRPTAVAAGAAAAAKVGGSKVGVVGSLGAKLVGRVEVASEV